MGKQVTFGLITGGTENGGDGIPIFKYGPIAVFFQGIAFDTAGTLVMPDFSAPLLDPLEQNWDSAKTPLGMHYWARGKVTFPLNGSIGG